MTRRSRRPIEATIRPSGGSPGLGGGDFREAMSHWASGVAILAASDGEEIDAITVSAFSALSLDPPLVLAAVGETASIVPMLREVARFTVSILAEDQAAIAGSVAQRLPGSERIYHALDDPSVVGALASLECALRHEYDGGDHRIIVGHVERVRLGPDREPLVHFRRDYRGLS
jgi:flavin reductase (DIM6/NTAB) family NADH-FMN oxidoreductase RutF